MQSYLLTDVDCGLLSTIYSPQRVFNKLCCLLQWHLYITYTHVVI